jgi:O-antigen biosynthesis protein WbqP
MKRLFDLAVALVVAVFLALPIVITALAVRLTSPGPVLY